MRSKVLVASISTLALVLLTASSAAAQNSNPRFGVWQLQSEAPPPAKNIMTYEPYGDGGMAITVASTNSRGEESEWGYVTMFDGVFRPVSGQENADTAVEIIDESSTRIRDGSMVALLWNANLVPGGDRTG